MSSDIASSSGFKLKPDRELFSVLHGYFLDFIVTLLQYVCIRDRICFEKKGYENLGTVGLYSKYHYILKIIYIYS